MNDSSSLVRAMIDALDEPALLVRGSTVSIANAAARRVLGATVEGRDVRIAVRHPQALAHIFGDRADDIEVTGLVDPGRSWRVSVRRLDSTSRLVRLRDISASVSAERMRVDFVANASHELRTPLSAVVGYAETLADEDDLTPDIISRFGGTIRDEARRMLRIVQDLMSLSRIEADRYVAPSQTIDLAPIITQSADTARRSRADRDVQVEIDPELPPVRGDEGQLLQLLDNLIGNALRYGCEADGSAVEVNASAARNHVRVTVTDRGPGIAREHLPRLTERFYRVDEARSRDSGGTGLGLSIVKHIVERHRGTLAIDSTVGVGTTVTVLLPAAR